MYIIYTYIYIKSYIIIFICNLAKLEKNNSYITIIIKHI